MERTFIILKPDCMEKNMAGKVLDRLFTKGLKPVAMKLVRLNDQILTEHYAHLKDKPFFPGILKFMSRSPVIMAVLEGEDAVNVVRLLCGPTNSTQAPAGTIRGDLGKDVQENIIHASDSKETAAAEIARFFKKEELC
ncbi:MAG: nucleoside-diphosphate kinase [Candidatus Micrarchaeia archaeon]